MLNFDNAPTYGRIEGIRLALNKLHDKNAESPFIIETGTTRGDLGGGPTADGWGTPLFGWYSKNHGGLTWTIDIEEEAINQCKEITKDFQDVIEYHVGDSSKIIDSANKHIDLLYLDSANDPNICLRELLAAEKNMDDNTIVYIDDTSLIRKRPGGVCKGILVYEYLYNKGWDVTFDNGDQIIMEKGNRSSRNFLERFRAKLKTQFIYARVLRRKAL